MMTATIRVTSCGFDRVARRAMQVSSIRTLEMQALLHDLNILSQVTIDDDSLQGLHGGYLEA